MIRTDFDFDTVKAQIDAEQETYFEEHSEYRQYLLGEIEGYEVHTHKTMRDGVCVCGYSVIATADEDGTQFIKRSCNNDLASTHDWLEVIEV